jgi:hypothetical protein
MTRSAEAWEGRARTERAAPELRPRVGTLKASIQFVQQYTPILKAPNGERYVARAYMSRQPGGLWEAWLVFFSLRTRVALATDRETTQSTREHVLYWATGLGETYSGALSARSTAVRRCSWLGVSPAPSVRKRMPWPRRRSTAPRRRAPSGTRGEPDVDATGKRGLLRLAFVVGEA